MERKIQIERVPPRQYRVLFEGKEIGVWKDPECSAARYLVAHGLATRNDALASYRGEALSMSAGIGWLADRQVEEGPYGPKYKPFRGVEKPAGVASDGAEDQ